jgi:hypothetical protein
VRNPRSQRSGGSGADTDAGYRAEGGHRPSGELFERAAGNLPTEVGQIEVRNEPPSEDRVHKGGILFASAH